ncbi:MAG: T9SS type A sorting domain-containing protein [Flavobacteriales bacterium]
MMRTPLLVSSLFAATCLLAQPTFQETDLLPAIGSTTTFRTTDYRTAGPATNNFVYNVSDLTLGASSSSTILLPSSTPYASSFPGATIATTGLTNPGTYAYIQSSATQQSLLGFKNADTEQNLSDPMKTVQFPLALGTSWTDNLAGFTEAGGFTLQRTGTCAGNYNGYGTIILPFGTFTNVARLELDQHYEDDIMGFTSISEVNTVTYLAAGLTSALFTVSYVLADQGFGLDTVSFSASMIDPSMVGIRENPAMIGAVLAPNPATGSTSLTLSTPAQGLSVVLIDAAGRVVREMATGITEQRIAINVEGLASGLYHVRANDNTGAMGNWPLMVE